MLIPKRGTNVYLTLRKERQEYLTDWAITTHVPIYDDRKQFRFDYRLWLNVRLT